MKRSADLQRTLAVTFTVVLTCMAVLGGSSDPPLVPVSRLGSVDDGSIVRIEGILVEAWNGDDGSETMVLLDPGSHATAKVHCTPGIGDSPGLRAGIGDRVLAEGEAAGSVLAPTLYATSDRVTVTRTSELVLSVMILADHWTLFEGDRFTICGELETDPSSGAARLCDSSGQTSILLHFSEEISGLSGSRVSVDGRLLVDKCHMYLYIEVDAICRA